MSPHRIFRDEDEVTWTAWDVTPNWGERRLAERRARTDGPPAGLSERRSRQRRARVGIRISLTPRLARGWLAFESDTMRCRLAPIPDEWHTLPERELRALLQRAEKVGPKRKRLIE